MFAKLLFTKSVQTTPALQYDYKAMNLSLWLIYRETVELMCIYNVSDGGPLPTVNRV